MLTEKKKDTTYTTSLLLHLHFVCVVGGIITSTLYTHAIYTPLMNKAKRSFREWWMMNRHHPPYTLAPFKAARGKKNTEHLYYFPSDTVWSVLCCFMKIHLDDSPEISRDTAQRLSGLLVWPISQTFVKVCGVSSQRTLLSGNVWTVFRIRVGRLALRPLVA